LPSAKRLTGGRRQSQFGRIYAPVARCMSGRADAAWAAEGQSGMPLVDIPGPQGVRRLVGFFRHCGVGGRTSRFARRKGIGFRGNMRRMPPSRLASARRA